MMAYRNNRICRKIVTNSFSLITSIISILHLKLLRKTTTQIFTMFARCSARSGSCVARRRRVFSAQRHGGSKQRASALHKRHADRGPLRREQHRRHRVRVRLQQLEPRGRQQRHAQVHDTWRHLAGRDRQLVRLLRLQRCAAPLCWSRLERTVQYCTMELEWFCCASQTLRCAVLFAAIVAYCKPDAVTQPTGTVGVALNTTVSAENQYACAAGYSADISHGAPSVTCLQSNATAGIWISGPGSCNRMLFRRWGSCWSFLPIAVL